MARGQISEQIEDVQYSYGLVSGQTILEVSGAVKLKSLVVGRKSSGELATLFDSAISGRYLSGGVSVVGLIHGGDGLNVPVQLDFDIGLNSGLVIVASGSQWLLTCTYK